VPISADCRRPHRRAPVSTKSTSRPPQREHISRLCQSNGGVGAVTLSHYRWIGLDLVVARLAPDYDPRAGRGCAAERRWWSGVGFH
jgi:hypothetical protein